MKKLFKHIGMVLSVALLGLAAACTPREIDTMDAAGLHIKVFFPTKVVAGQPMTVNGTGLAGVREVVFPGGVSVTDIEHVGNGMIRLTAPAGISSAGGKLIVRSADDEAESKEDLTLGNTVVTGFSKQDGEDLTGGEQLTVFGTDLEFICRAELFDNEGNPLILEDEAFYRKGTSAVILNIPNRILEGTWIGKLYTFDGKEIPLPELNYKPGGGGHWETVKKVYWTNDDPAGHGPANWNGTYRFALEGHDGNNECIAELPQEVWDIIKNGTFYATFQLDPNWFQIRITNGHWSVQWQGAENDFTPNNMADRLIPNDDGTRSLEITFGNDPLVETLDDRHLLFTGSGNTLLELYGFEEVWVEGDGGDEGHWETVETTIWGQETPFPDWSATILIGPENFVDVKEGNIVRVYVSDKGSDYNPIFKHENWSDWTEFQGQKVDGDGYFEAPVPAEAIEELQSTGLRFQGVGFTITKVVLIHDEWIGGGGHMETVETTIWGVETPFPDWSATILIGPENFADVQEGDIVRVYVSDKGSDYNPIFKHENWSDWTEFQGQKVDGDGYFEAPVPADAIGELQSTGLRFQGVGFTITKVVLIQEKMVGGDDGPKEVVLWGVETPFPDWSATILIGPEKFLDVQAGQIVHVEIKDKGSDYNPIFKHENWSDWTEFQGQKVDGDGYFEAPVPADAIGELQSTGLRFQGVGFTIVKVTLLP